MSHTHKNSRAESVDSCDLDPKLSATIRCCGFRQAGTLAKNLPPMLRAREAAALIGVEEKTLANWRWKGIGPSFIKLPGRSGRGAVRYRPEVLAQWLCDRAKNSTSDQREIIGGEK